MFPIVATYKNDIHKDNLSLNLRKCKNVIHLYFPYKIDNYEIVHSDTVRDLDVIFLLLKHKRFLNVHLVQF